MVGTPYATVRRFAEVCTTNKIAAYVRSLGSTKDCGSLPDPEMVKPVQLTPTDLLLLTQTSETNEELTGVVHVQVNMRAFLSREVIDQAMATAILAYEEAGVLRLEVAQEESFFGLFTRTVLRAIRVDKAQWPTDSLEAVLERSIPWLVRADDVQWPTDSLEALLECSMPYGSKRVSDIIYDWLDKDSDNPRSTAGASVRDGMVRRGLLDVEVIQRKVLRFFKVTSKHYLLPEHTSALVRQQLVGFTLRQVAACQQTRPEVHDLLMKEIGDGFSRRVYDSD
ncbi:MAG: hypothetical protein HW403_1308 [Dehalococcoidia bacterium]|nr:hypothetical protein [Dehalococcoidia bacterium]